MSLEYRVPAGELSEESLAHIIRLIETARAGDTGRAIRVAIVPEKRSLEQNALMWVWIRAIGRFLGCDNTDQTKDFLLTECYGEYYETIGGRKIQVYPSTSKFNVEQMSRWMQWLEHYAGENGIPLPADPNLEEG